MVDRAPGKSAKRKEPGQLRLLIQRLENAYANQSPYISKIPDTPALIRALTDLEQVIGNETVKERTADQITLLIAKKNQNANARPPMLHALLFGGPGTGKTTIAKKLGEIYSALGYLKGPGEAVKSTYNPHNFGSTSDWNAEAMILWLVILVFIFYFCSFIYRWFGLYGVMVVVSFLLIVLTTLWFFGYIGSNSSPTTDPTETTKTSSKHRGVVTVVCRDNFIAPFMGQSAAKTNQLLHDNLGNVLFVDEAYNLITGERDDYGMEALTALNLFMSEHPGEIIVIFAGYRHLIEQNIMKAQEGLKRRFLWKFNCTGYSLKQTCRIFLQQISREGLTVRSPKEILALFRANPNSFPNFGGDTENLSTYAQMVHSRDLMKDDGSTDLMVLETRHVSKGLEILHENMMEEAPKVSAESKIAEVMKMMGMA